MAQPPLLREGGVFAGPTVFLNLDTTPCARAPTVFTGSVRPFPVLESPVIVEPWLQRNPAPEPKTILQRRRVMLRWGAWQAVPSGENRGVGRPASAQ